MPNTWTLNLFLLEPHIQQFTDALADPNDNDLHVRTVKNNVGFTGALYYKFGSEHEPTWTKLVTPNLKIQTAFPESQSVSAVLFVGTATAKYAYVFGVGGRSLLDKESFVPDFGKKVVLSVVNPKELRSIDLRATRGQTFLTRQQATRATGLRSFGIDTLQDHLRAVAGVPLPLHAGLASRLSGADSLAFRSRVNFNQLGTKADAFKIAFDGAAYKNIDDFKWIDQVTVERNQAKINHLDGLMVAEIQQNNFGFSPPEILDWHLSPTFSFEEDAPENERMDFLTPQALIDAVGAANVQNLTAGALKALPVYCFFNQAADWTERWRAYDCIELDVVDQNQQYVFGGGRWSAIAANFLTDVDNYVQALRNQSPAFPVAMVNQDVNAKGNLDEGAYILRVTQANNNLAKVHGHNPKIMVGGDEVELCDIYDAARDFIHLKIWRGSQGFSALAMQGSNSAEFLLENRKFEADSRAKLVSMGNIFAGALPAGFNPRDYRVILGLIRRQAGDIPFFSRLTLMRAAERIIGRGMRVGFSVIAVK